MSAWASYDYNPSDNKSGPWIKCVPWNPIRDEEVNMLRRFGEMECAFDKAGYKFVFGKKLSQRKKMCAEYYAKEPMKSIKTHCGKDNGAILILRMKM